MSSPPPGSPSPPSNPAAQRPEPPAGDAAPATDDGWSLPSIFGRAMVAGPHLQVEPELGELTGLTGIAADWPVERWRAEAAAIEAAEDEALGRSRPGVIDDPPPLEFAPAPDRSWPDALASPAPPQWSSTTYVGPTRLLPDEPPPGVLPGPIRREDDRGGAARSVLASSKTMAIASLASRITGFLRSIALVAALGTGLVSDAYNGANSFPNSVYELLLGGVLSSVLIPLLVHASEHDSDHGVAYTQRLLSIATSALAVTTLIAVALAPYIADLFVEAGPQRTLASTFATLLLPEIFFYGLGAMFVAVLNTRQIYGPGAWAPVANNVITIITVVIYLAVPGPAIPTPSSITNTQILVLGIGTTLGIVAQAFILVPSLRRAGFRWMWRFRGRPNEAGRLAQAARLSGWVLGYVAVSQIGVLVVTKVAFTFGDRYHHGVTTFTNADLLFQVPFGILGVSLLTAIMPRMARAASRNDKASVIADINLGARLSSLALLPITVGLIVLGPAFTVVVFAHGKTAIGDARLIGDALAWSAFGLVPFAFVMLQLRVFYALREGRTPTLINVFMVGTKVALVLLAEANLHGNAAVISLNVSTSASYVVGAVVGHFLLRRRMGPLGFRTVAIGVAQVGVACAAGGLAAYGLVLWCAGLFGHGRGGALAGLVSGSLVGLVIMGIVAWLLAIPEARQIGVRLGVKRRS